VAQAVAEGWSGVEALAGIPGLVGATPIQNVGAYGQEVSDTLAQVRVLDRHGGAMRTLARDACGLSYRSSRFKEDPSGYVVTAVQFRFPVDPLGAPVRYAELAKALGVPLGTRVPAATVLETVLALRKSKGMIWEADEACPGSAGSFFTNPIVTTAEAAAVEERARQEGHLPPGETMPRFPASEGRQKLAAAWLVERAGFSKGTRRGSVGVSARHALSLVHYGGGTAAELVALAREVRDGVRERFGVVLVPEPVFLGMVWA
jgi:UDP-N-acetylmuramate dehydrogenase